MGPWAVNSGKAFFRMADRQRGHEPAPLGREPANGPGKRTLVALDTSETQVHLKCTLAPHATAGHGGYKTDASHTDSCSVIVQSITWSLPAPIPFRT